MIKHHCSPDLESFFPFCKPIYFHREFASYFLGCFFFYCQYSHSTATSNCVGDTTTLYMEWKNPNSTVNVLSNLNKDSKLTAFLKGRTFWITITL